MNRLFKYLPVLTLLAAAGCSSLPDKITPEEASKHPTINDLIGNTVGFDPKWYIAKNERDKFADMVKPYIYARDYCAYQGGEMVKSQDVEKGPYDVLIKSLPYELPVTATGAFQCKMDGKTDWALVIKVTEVKPLLDSIDVVRFNTKVEIITLKELAARQIKRTADDIASAKREKSARIWAEQKQREKEQRRIAQEQENREQDQWRRDAYRDKTAHDSNIGHKICKNGKVEYPYFTGNYSFGIPLNLNHRMNGQLQGYLEGFSKDRYRIQVRMSGWSAHGASHPQPTDYPRMNGLTSQAGVLQWDDVTGWFNCD